MKKLEELLEWGWVKKDITFLIISGIALLLSIFKVIPDLPFDATVGIAMGGVGSDIAVDAADIALVDDEVKELPHLFALSKRMMTKIKFNLTFSMLLNFVAIVLAMTGILNPVIGALVHNTGSVFVIINSAFLMKDKSV